MAAGKDANNGLPLRLASEFAAVEVARDDRGNGPRLMIRDTRSGRSLFLSIRSSLPRSPAPATRT